MRPSAPCPVRSSSVKFLVTWLPTAPKIQSSRPVAGDVRPFVGDVPDVLTPGLQLDERQLRPGAEDQFDNPAVQRVPFGLGRRGGLVDESHRGAVFDDDQQPGEEGPVAARRPQHRVQRLRDVHAGWHVHEHAVRRQRAGQRSEVAIVVGHDLPHPAFEKRRMLANRRAPIGEDHVPPRQVLAALALRLVPGRQAQQGAVRFAGQRLKEFRIDRNPVRPGAGASDGRGIVRKSVRRQASSVIVGKGRRS